jgi:hypothetical protein
LYATGPGWWIEQGHERADMSGGSLLAALGLVRLSQVAGRLLMHFFEHLLDVHRANRALCFLPGPAHGCPARRAQGVGFACSLTR